MSKVNINEHSKVNSNSTKPLLQLAFLRHIDVKFDSS